MAELSVKEDDAENNPTDWFVYILRCADGSFYTGITTDLTRRCEQHNAGTAARYTHTTIMNSFSKRIKYEYKNILRNMCSLFSSRVLRV